MVMVRPVMMLVVAMTTIMMVLMVLMMMVMMVAVVVSNIFKLLLANGQSETARVVLAHHIPSGGTKDLGPITPLPNLALWTKDLRPQALT